MERPLRVVVVGAGMSGLAAASMLVEKTGNSGLELTILEASSYVGGRVRVDHQWRDVCPIDMGGEFIHGELSILVQMAEQHGWTFHEVMKTSLCAQAPARRSVFLNGKLTQLWDTSNPAMAEALEAWKTMENRGIRANEAMKRRLNDATALAKAVDSDQDCCCCSGNSSTSSSICDLSRSDSVCSCDIDAEDYSLADMCEQLGVGEDARAILQAVIVQTDGGRWKDFGMADFCEVWPYGEVQSRFDGSYSVLLKHYLKSLSNATASVTVQVSSPVFAVEAVQTEEGHDNGMVIRFRRDCTEDDESYIECDYVIMTVPLTVLQKRAITFEPALPRQVQHAVDSLPMYSAIKVYLRFKAHFWPAGVNFIYSCQGVLSQYWANCRPRSNDPATILNADAISGDCGLFGLLDDTNRDGFVQRVSRSDILGLNRMSRPSSSSHNCQSCCSQHDGADMVHLLCGFATAEVADLACEHDAKTLVLKALAQLDEMTRSSSDTMTLASSCFEAALVCDWTKHPYVMGGYSAPAVGGVEFRPILSQPVFNDRLVFAGEATNVQPSSVQAAVETGIRAATAVLHSATRSDQYQSR